MVEYRIWLEKRGRGSNYLTRSGTVHFSHDVSHPGLVAHECGQVAGLRGIVLGKSLHLAAMAARPLAGQEAQGAVARRGKLPVRLQMGKYDIIKRVGFVKSED